MQITVTSGDKSVSVTIEGASEALLAQAEQVASRLLAGAPAPASKPPIGFSVVAETEQADDVA